MTYSGRKVLVTGADGFIGSHLTEALVGAGAEVTALSQYNSFDRNGWLDDLAPDVLASVQLVSGDVRDAYFLRSLAEGKDVVFHLAALIAIPFSYAAPQSYIDVNISGTLNVLEACKAGGAGRMVHTSTSEVYGTALFTPITEDHPMQGQSPYSASKIGADHMVEAYARSFDIPAVTLRPFNTYGPRQSERAVISSTIRQVLDPDCAEIRLGDLSPSRDFNFVRDTAQAFLAIGAADTVEYGTAYNAGTGHAVTIGEMVEVVREITGSNQPVVAEEARLRPEKSEVRLLLAGSDRLTAATGWTPETSFNQGLEATIDWWRHRIRQGAQRRASGYLL